eukprot:jgi/Chlat1/6740/Chrsp50S06437
MAGVMGHLINTVFFWKAHSHGCQAKIDIGENENPDSAILKFRRVVNSAGLIPEVRRRAHFETPQDVTKRKFRTRIANRRMQQRRGGAPKTLADKRAEVAKAKEGAEAYKERVLQRAQRAERYAANAQARVEGSGSAPGMQVSQAGNASAIGGDLNGAAGAASASASTPSALPTSTSPRVSTSTSTSRSSTSKPPTVSKSAAAAAGVEKGAGAVR